MNKLLLKTVMLAGVFLSGAHAESLKQTLYYGGDIVTMEGDKLSM